MSLETLNLFKNIRKEGYKGTLEEYQREGGFEAMKKALSTMKPEEVVETVKASGLRGRGGAGFPTGLKWSFMAKVPDKPSYLVCNADESEPGTCKDREIMLHDPHLLLEGMVIGCFAVGCKHGYIYVRGEYFPSIKRLKSAIQDMREAGLLGKNILNTGVDIELTVHPGAGAYICGEETALLDSLEGKRGQPRFKPPFPAVSGFDDCPTSVNNVETIANIPSIMTIGPEAFQALGCENNAGTRLVCISGCVNKPGVYEVCMGSNLKDIIYELGGGLPEGRTLKGVIPGGSSVPVLLPEELDISFDFDSVAKSGSMMGSCGIVVIDDSVHIPAFLHRIIRFYNHESCGQCTPCREGMNWLRVLLRDLLRGKGDENTLKHINRVAGNIMGNTLCALGDAGAMPTLAFLKKYPEEFQSLISN